MRAVTIILPVKELDRAKSRLQDVLGPEARRSLVLEMFERVLEGSMRSRAARVRVVTRDRDVEARALGRGVEVSRDSASDLNASLLAEFRRCWSRGAAPLYLPGDLPHVDADAIDALIDAWSEEHAIVLAPAHDDGTNALLVPAASPLAPSLGERSFERHLTEAARLGYPTRVLRLRALELDVDTPADLEAVRSLA